METKRLNIFILLFSIASTTGDCSGFLDNSPLLPVHDRTPSMSIAFRDDILEQNNSLNNIFFKKDNALSSKVKFFLFTRRNVKAEKLRPNDEALLKASHFNTQKPTKFIIHGYLDNVNRPMPQKIKNNFLRTDDVNVIVVDWGEIAIGINYFAIADATPEIGLYLSQMMDFLVSKGCNPKRFHLIGHSLGAHIAGFAGAAVLKGKPFRITGLDPAKPKFNNVDPTKRLDPNDADFVDCIHTCGGMLGLYDPICHADFYPNGGKNIQPGCHFFDFGRCSHIRSFEYFAESILPKHKFPAMICKWHNKPDECSPSSVNMGNYMGNYVNSNARGVFYVKTNSRAPFAPYIGRR